MYRDMVQVVEGSTEKERLIRSSVPSFCSLMHDLHAVPDVKGGPILLRGISRFQSSESCILRVLWLGTNFGISNIFKGRLATNFTNHQSNGRHKISSLIHAF